MALPLGAIASSIVKKLTFDVLTDPEKGVKYISYAFLGLCLFILIFVMPVVLLVNIPFIILHTIGINPQYDEYINKLPREKLAIYSVVPEKLNKLAMEWVREQESSYSYCDDIVVSFNFSLDWSEILSIDAVKRKQYFNDVTESEVLDFAEMFVSKSVSTEKYTEVMIYEEEEYYEEDEEYTDPVTKETKTTTVTKSRIVTKTKTVEKLRALISVNTLSFGDVIGNMNFSSQDYDIATKFYNSTKGLNLEDILKIYDEVTAKPLPQ